MGDKKKSKGFFKKMWDTLTGQSSGGEGDLVEDQIDLSKTESKPVDLNFVQNFNESGGKFLYCEEEDEAYEYLKNISLESQIGDVYCDDEGLRSILQKAQIQLTDDLDAADAFCSGCEYLVSFNGGIMLSAEQTKGKNLNELPEVFITVAQASQITKNLSSALSGIRARYPNNIPSQITTIKGPNKRDEVTSLGGSSFYNKEIYLLLIEDQLE